MPQNSQAGTAQVVMDVLPWPGGRGFRGADAWWDYVLTKDERQRLDQLLGLALLDQSICKRLLDHDKSLSGKFGLSESTQNWLETIPANSLTELAEAIVAGPLARPEAA
jgi:hypothetical protein